MENLVADLVVKMSFTRPRLWSGGTGQSSLYRLDENGAPGEYHFDAGGVQAIIWFVWFE